MALTTYRSVVPITTQARKIAAYEKLRDLLDHLVALGVDLTRVELMGDNFIEVDLTGTIATAQRDHFSLTGPV